MKEGLRVSAEMDEEIVDDSTLSIRKIKDHFYEWRRRK